MERPWPQLHLKTFNCLCSLHYLAETVISSLNTLVSWSLRPVQCDKGQELQVRSGGTEGTSGLGSLSQTDVTPSCVI